MATAAEIIVKLVDQTKGGIRSITGQVEKLDKAGKAASRSMGGIKTAIGGIAAAASGGVFISLLDEVQTLDNRLKLVTGSQDELNATFDTLVETANRTRGPIAETTELFTKLSLSAEQLGLNQEELIGITEAFNTTLALSGANTQEAAAATLQFAQAMASGALRGDEFRSLNEANPVLMSALAEQLGITRGELREYAGEGLLTAEIVTKALQEATEDLQDQFADTDTTIGQALTILSNNFKQLTQDFNQNSGAGAIVADAILLVADNLETLVPFAVAAVAAIGTGLVVAFGALVGPIGLAVGAVAGIAAAIITFKDDIIGFISNALEPVIEGFNNMKESVENMAGVVVDKFNSIKNSIVNSLTIAGANVDAFFSGVTAAIKDPFNATEAFSQAFEKTLVEALAEAQKANEEFTETVEDSTKTIEDSTETVEENSDKLDDNTEATDSNTDQTNDHTDAEEDNTDAIDDNTDAQDDNKTAAELLQEQLNKNENQVKAVTGAYDDFSAELERSIELARVDSAEREIQTEIQRGLEAQAKALGKQVSELTATEVENVTTYVSEQVKKRQAAEQTADDLQDFDTETNRIIEQNYKDTTDAVKQLEDSKQEYIANARALGLEDAKSTQDAILAYDRMIADEQKKINDERIKDFVDKAEKYREDQLSATDIYNQQRLDLQEALDDGIILSEEDRIDYLRAINEEYIDGITSEYNDLYGFFEGKIRDFTGLTRQEFGIMEEIVQLTFGVNVTDVIKGTFAAGIQSILGFRTSGNTELGGFAEDANTPFSTIGNIIDGVFGGANSIGLGSIGTFVVAGFELLGGLASDIFTLFGGVGDFLGNTFGGAFKSISGAISSLFGGGGGGSGGIFTALGSVFGPVGSVVGGIIDFFFADGGYIKPGQVGIVGEMGPELVSGPANVTSTEDTASLLGSRGVNVNFTINAVDAKGIDQLLLDRKPMITNIVRQAVNKQGRRL